MSTPPEGWYPDPAGTPELERFWDGAMWTPRTRPVGGPEVPPPPTGGASIRRAAAPPGPGSARVIGRSPVARASRGGRAAVGRPVAGRPTASGGPPAAVGTAAEPMAAPAAEASAAPAAEPPGGDPLPGIGGIRTELLTETRFAEVESSHRVTRQNSRLLKVVLGDDIVAKQGTMVAFQGRIDFDFEGSGAVRFIKKGMTGEGVPLMRCSGEGELFLADSAHQVHIVHLDDAGLTVNGRNVLAFEPTLSWDIERVRGGAMMAGGLFNTRLHGRGWVAITTDGDPVVLRTDQPTYADTDAAVAWTSTLTTSVNRTFKAQSLIGRGSGEAVQLAFQGTGIVIVQPSEGPTVPSHSH